MRTQAWLSSRQSTTHDTEFGEERHRETSARNGYRLSSFADGSDGADCPNIGTDGECCRCIGQALKKIDRTCPAHIIKHITHDGISVVYYATHLCYTDISEQLSHVRLSAADREWLAGKLALQIPPDAVLRDVRRTFNGQLTRLSH